MNEYHKIQTVWKRDPDNRYRTLLEGEWALPEFELLQGIDWEWTEKVDGTNIRVSYDGEHVRFGGKTERAQIPTHLLAVLQDQFNDAPWADVFPQVESQVTLYGEGFGAKIQKGGNYDPSGCHFILFDVKVGDWWLRRDDVMDVAERLGVRQVPVVGTGPLKEAIAWTRVGVASLLPPIFGGNADYNAEGLVMRPVVDLFTRRGDRIITKIKHKDFQ